MLAAPIETYRRKVENELQAASANGYTRHIHHPDLDTLIEALMNSVPASNDRKHVELVAVDLVVMRTSHHCPVKLASQDVAQLLRCDQPSQFAFAPLAFPEC
jgi:hypothetical protein